MGHLSSHAFNIYRRKPNSMVLGYYRTLLAVVLSVHSTLTAYGWYIPPKNVSWQYQLSDTGSAAYIPGVDLYVIDIDTARDFIPYVKKKNPVARVVCYFSAGTFESYRVDDDADRGPYSFVKEYWGSSIGRPMDGWPGEYWVDVRSKRVRRIAKKRIKFAKRIGCAGVDPDNVDGYTFGKKETGFALSRKDQESFNVYLAETAHSLGLGIGLKNAIELVKRIGSNFDWFMNESCFTFGECMEYSKKSSILRKKALFIVEYCDARREPTQDPGCYCPISLSHGWNTLIKRADLGISRLPCSVYCQQENPSWTCSNSTRKVQMNLYSSSSSSSSSCPLAAKEDDKGRQCRDLGM